jgi:hypothetical protein
MMIERFVTTVELEILMLLDNVINHRFVKRSEERDDERREQERIGRREEEIRRAIRLTLQLNCKMDVMS